MTTKLTVAPCKCENNSVKKEKVCKEKKKKKKKFPISGSKQTKKMGKMNFPTSHFRLNPNKPNKKEEGRKPPLNMSTVNLNWKCLLVQPVNLRTIPENYFDAAKAKVTTITY